MKQRFYECGLEAALDMIGGKWKVLILWQLQSRPRRFGELKRLVGGISEKMLIQTLREMESDEIVQRRVFHEIPPKVEYSATRLGISLNDALTPLCEWGEKNARRIRAIRMQCDVGSAKARPDRAEAATR